MVVTFDPHPAKVLRPDASAASLTSTAHKIRLIRELGVATSCWSLHSTAPSPRLRPRSSSGNWSAAAQPLREICVGHEWSFGKNRAGNLALLEKLGAKLDFDVVGVPPVTNDGRVVSSTAIRQAVEGR